MEKKSTLFFPFFLLRKETKNGPCAGSFFPFRTLFSLSSPPLIYHPFYATHDMYTYFFFPFVFTLSSFHGVWVLLLLCTKSWFFFLFSPLALVGFSIKFDFYGRMVQVGLGAGNVFICNLMSLRLGTTKRWYGACDTRIEKSPLDNNVSTVLCTEYKYT